MVNGVDFSKIGNIIGIKPAGEVKSEGIKLGGFGYGFSTTGEVGLERENRVPAWLVDHFAQIPEKAIRPDGTQLVINGELMPDGCDKTEPAYSES